MAKGIVAYGYQSKDIDTIEEMSDNGTNFYIYKGLRFLSKFKPENKKLAIIFHGAVYGSGLERTFFRGHDYTLENTNIICVSDFLMTIYKNYTINWTLSTKKINSETIYSQFFDGILKPQKYDTVVFAGTSAGGFPAIKFASKYNEEALVANSQLYLEKYGLKELNTGINGRGFYHLVNLLEEHQDHVIYNHQDINNIIMSGKPKKITIYQNTLDAHYVDDVIPLQEFLSENNLLNILDVKLFSPPEHDESTNHHALQFPENVNNLQGALESYLD